MVKVWDIVTDIYAALFQDCPIRNISEGSLSLNIPQTSLVPFQDYQVKVRSLVSPGKDSSFRGIPSVWTVPVIWTSHDGTLLQHRQCIQMLQISDSVIFCYLWCLLRSTNGHLPCADSPDSHLVPPHPDLYLHQHVCGHSLLHNILQHSGLSEVLMFSVFGFPP